MLEMLELWVEEEEEQEEKSGPKRGAALAFRRMRRRCHLMFRKTTTLSANAKEMTSRT